VRTFGRNLSVSVVAGVALAGLGDIQGCARGDRVEIGSAAYSGPPIEVTAGAGQHMLVLTAPTGGWAFRMDRSRKDLGRTEVFVSAVRPDPAYMQTQALVRHELATEVPGAEKIVVYGRVLGHDQTEGAYGPVDVGGR
jgi:hypothetical protein